MKTPTCAPCTNARSRPQTRSRTSTTVFVCAAGFITVIAALATARQNLIRIVLFD